MDMHETTVTTVMVLVFAAVAGLFIVLGIRRLARGALFCWALSVK